VGAETRYHPSAEQLALASTIEESLADILPRSRLHTAHDEDAKTWSSLEEIGIFGIGVSEEHGGSGLGAVEEALIVTALGRHLVAPGVLAAVGAAHLPSDQGPGALRGRRVAAAYRRGGRVIVVGDAKADLVLVRDRDAAALYEAGEAEAEASRVVDDRLWLATLSEASGLRAALARADASHLARLRLIDAAALSGIAEAALQMAVGYAALREQFGRPIGSFQAVKHHCANMVMAARCARDQTNFAAVALDEGRPEAALQVECALFVAGSAALENAGKNIQIHGGIGFSDEADPHLFLKRAQLMLAIAGGLEAANGRIANTKVG
jgi:alkylation response protein AidB-like acyl-CoA dehydrogenase